MSTEPMKPLISIIIPTYNRAEIIPRTLDSVRNQDYQNWECIIVDDHSTDNTKEVIFKYCNTDNRFKYFINSRKKGAQGARNEGIVQASGEWVLLFDSDDYLFPSYLKKLVESIPSGSQIIACYGQMIEEGSGKKLEEMNRIYSGDIHRELLIGENYVTFQTAIIKKDSLLNIGLLDEECPSHQEWDTHIRLSAKYKYTVVPEILWDYYVGREDTISYDKTKHIAGLIHIVKKNYWEYRCKYYRYFLRRMKNIWKLTENNERKTHFRRQIYLLAPELIILHPKDK